MIVKIKGKNKYSPTPDVKRYAEEKLKKLERLFTDKSVPEATLVCEKYPSYFIVEITIPTKRLLLRSETTAPDIAEAIDFSIDKLSTQIKKHNGRISNRQKQQNSLGKEIYNMKVELDAKELEMEDLANSIVKTKEFDLEPMTEREAILQMELLDHDFFVFRNVKTNDVNLIYTRKDKKYGVIRVRS